MRVLYERHGSGAGAFGLIDDGHIHAWRELGAEVRVWRSMDPSEPPLRELLASFRPTYLLANLQTARRAPSAWLGASDLDALERARGETGLRVAARSAPSNLADLMRGADIAFDRFDGAGTTSYYTQPVRPVGTERAALERGLIDVVRSPAHAACYPVAFRSFLDMGVSVVEEMHAADATRYRPLSASEAEHSAEVLFIGNCWPFKWAQMGAYVRGLRARFGDRFVIRGNGWPREAGALGPIADEGVGAANPMNRLANGASVQVALHEPTQVLPFPFTGNERPYKLMLMGLAVVSDDNPVMRDHFRAGEELWVASSPDEMVAACERLAADPGARVAMGAAARARVAAEHTYAARATRLRDVLERPGRGLIWGRTGEPLECAWKQAA